MIDPAAPLTVEVRGIEVHAYHGVHEHEQRDGQRFRLDVRLQPRSAAACETDRLADAVDYGAVARLVAEVATTRRFDLIERLGAAVGDAILTRFPVDRAWVTVHKPDAPIPLAFDDVAVTVLRSSARGL